MTGAGHTHTGIGLSISIYYFSYKTLSEVVSERTFLTNTGFDMYLLIIVALISAFVCVSGATAPDWLEIRKKGGGTVIKHRTITHWVLLWVLLLALGLNITNLEILSDTILSSDLFLLSSLGALIVGFSAGGLSHLLTDLPNKQGIPILFPNQRFCLYAWKSGRNEQFLITMAYVFSIFYIGIDSEIIRIDTQKLLTILGFG